MTVPGVFFRSVGKKICCFPGCLKYKEKVITFQDETSSDISPFILRTAPTSLLFHRFHGILQPCMSAKTSYLHFPFDPLLLFDTEETAGDHPEAKALDTPQDEYSDNVRCTACGFCITHRSEKIERDDRFEHICTNPGGHVFRVGCFRKATGCLVFGEPTEFFTWFPGYGWSCATCRSCAVHLGWLFTSASDSFFALILDTLSGW